MTSSLSSWRRALASAGRVSVGCTASLLLCAAAGAQTAAPAVPAGPAPAAPALTANGKVGQGIANNGLPPAVAACATCHGPRGEGSAAFPPLAGNGTAYLLAQLQAFADGSRAQAIMGPIAKGLNAQQRADVVAFYAGQPSVQHAVTVPAANPADAGAWLVQRGRWADGIPACAQCHGPDGRGVGEHFPAIAGLSAAYMQAQVTAWQSGKRPPGPLQLMVTVAQKLTPQDLTAIAAYYLRLQEQPVAGAASLAPQGPAPAAAVAPSPSAVHATSQGKP
ncbi:c-type cytochrome [Simplicispira psychrophila]|uniref:c-type cytochrome n=1 Tax=Simplicispira psychrophila TaxID=80882 RepID=UPI00068C059D|nr:c-type cytochrome [Simplicispira psychrophila]